MSDKKKGAKKTGDATAPATPAARDRRKTPRKTAAESRASVDASAAEAVVALTTDMPPAPIAAPSHDTRDSAGLEPAQVAPMAHAAHDAITPPHGDPLAGVVPTTRTVAEETYGESTLTTDAPAVSRNTRTARVGLFVGREWSFPPAFLQAVERRDAGVTAELAKIGAPKFEEPSPYDLCIDRISHEVPVYRSYLKQAALTGTTVVNNPFMWTADDKFFGASLAHALGVASPKTVVLPNREYVPGIVPSESLRNMEYPLDWQGIADYVGMPCVLKDAHGGGWKEVYICHSLQELIHHYNHSGLLTMIVQEFIEFEHFVRCLVIGREEVLPMKYDPKNRKYVVDHAHLTAELGTRIVGDARKLCRALGYDMNSMEFAIRGGVPYAIDFMNPAPDMDVNSLTPTYFEWAVETMADMAVRLATEARDGGRATREPSWGTLFGGVVGRGGR
ncbi:ATP-grasp domain-containing protein [Roseisolibacter agri]|uniref:ATP-grasp domain-containing protein n=1 Tax=Roseisolibacter agri TaxID=2014610 RepID=A0AA37QEZ1_9BACT|nr:hypothetical protein [Roseisolibacter agri]GLC25548.1 hypothetical protein rosag_20610 [Roseisolibacter agri]